MMGGNEILDKIVNLTTHTIQIKADVFVKVAQNIMQTILYRNCFDDIALTNMTFPIQCSEIRGHSNIQLARFYEKRTDSKHLKSIYSRKSSMQH